MLNAACAGVNAGTDQKILLLFWNHGVGRLAVHVDASRPIRCAKRKGAEELARLCLVHIGEAVLGRVQDHLALTPPHIRAEDERLGGGVLVVEVVGSLLKIPFQFSSVGIEGEQRRSIEIGARTRGCVNWSRIACTPVDQIELWIIGTGKPGPAACRFPVVVWGS